MATRRRRGMDHTLYPYSPMVRRPPLRWPSGAQLAFWIVLHLEYWELDPPPEAFRDPRFKGEFGSYFPDYRTWSTREYGNRIGIFRIMDVLERHGLKATVAVNALACERYPALMEEIVGRGWELAAHGQAATRMITSRMGEAEERAYIDASIHAVEQAWGRRPEGWLSQDFGESVRTPALLAEAGITYLMDWVNDEQPYRMTQDGALVSLPYQVEWDDVQLLWVRRLPTARYPEVVQDAFDTLHREGEVSGRLFMLGLHPWVLGTPARIRYLDEALDRIAGREKVWQASAGEIAGWFDKQERP